MRFLKMMIGMVLLPLVAAVGWTLLDLSRLLWTGREWGEPWFWALGGGFAGWLLIWLLLPRPLWVYVLGHELTHALAVYLHGGKVHQFKVTSAGGISSATRAIGSSRWLPILSLYIARSGSDFGGASISTIRWRPTRRFSMPGWG